jgi:hypothetical protein
LEKKGEQEDLHTGEVAVVRFYFSDLTYCLSQ